MGSLEPAGNEYERSAKDKRVSKKRLEQKLAEPFVDFMEQDEAGGTLAALHVGDDLGTGPRGPLLQLLSIGNRSHLDGRAMLRIDLGTKLNLLTRQFGVHRLIRVSRQNIPHRQRRLIQFTDPAV